MPAVEPGGPYGVSVTAPTSVAVPSPQLIVAVWVSSVPGSVNVAGASATIAPSSAFWSGPASTAGGRFTIVMVSESQVVAPSSSVTQTNTVYAPLSAYTWLPETVPFMPAVEPGGPYGVSVTAPASVGVPSPQSMVAEWVSSVPRSLNVAGARPTIAPSSAFWSAPASTVGATFSIVMDNESQVSAPSSSSTQTSTVYVPLSA